MSCANSKFPSQVDSEMLKLMQNSFGATIHANHVTKVLEGYFPNSDLFDFNKFNFTPEQRPMAAVRE